MPRIARPTTDFDMKTKRKNRKIWLGVGAFVVVGATAPGAAGPLAGNDVTDLRALTDVVTDTAISRTSSGGFVVAQHGDHAPKADESGEEGGEKGVATLPPTLAFGVRIALLRGHLLVGDELVKQQQWNAALPHFLHPGEEIYADIKDQLAEYKVPPFEDALKALAGAVKAKRGGNDYAKALKSLNEALAAADAAMKQKETDWVAFVVAAALESIKVAVSEYQAAIIKGRIAKPVEYQDARGFIFQAERMIDGVAPELEKKDEAALRAVRTAFAELRKAFPSPLPPRAPIKDHGTLLGDVSRIELAAGRLM
jgi:hypothetical protein